MKKFIYGILTLLLVGILIPNGAFASNGSNDESVINEKFGLPILVFGGNLNKEQRQEVRNILNIKDQSTVEELEVTGKDLYRYVKGSNINSRMFSSAKITRLEEGNGIEVERLTPENITEVTDEMYINAMITAGITDARVEIVSPVKVTGHSALAGIYKAFESEGEELDKDRMEVANKELEVVTSIVGSGDASNDQINELLASIKQEISKQKPDSREAIEEIVQSQLEAKGINLSDEDVSKLVDLFDQMRQININFDDVKDQLDGIVNGIQDKLKEVAGTDTEGFWNSVKEFFVNLFESIGNLFSNSSDETNKN